MSNRVKKYEDEYGTVEYKELPVEDGDVIVVKAGVPTDMIDRLAEMLGDTGRPRSIIVAVNKMSDIKALDQNVMANYGWYRNDRLREAKRVLESMIIEEAKKPNNIAGLLNGIYFTVTGEYYKLNHEKMAA